MATMFCILFFFFWSDEHVLELIVVMVNSVNTLKTMTCTI